MEDLIKIQTNLILFAENFLITNGKMFCISKQVINRHWFLIKY